MEEGKEERSDASSSVEVSVVGVVLGSEGAVADDEASVRSVTE